MNASDPLAPRDRLIETLPEDQRLWILSDLHLGDGTPSDAFFGKDPHLVALMERIEHAGDTLIVNGDAIDFHQAWSFMRVLRAHPVLLRAMSRLGREGRLIYVIGNHDYDITVFRDILNFRVCHEVRVGETMVVRHGYEYDPYISEMLEHGQWHTVVHHVVERVLGTWLRIPLAEFYTRSNRLLFWLAHKLGVAAWLITRATDRFGLHTTAHEVLANLDFWTWSNLGDAMGIFRPAWQDARTGRFRIVVCGHSHLPGVVRDGDAIYANCGSWTFASSQYLRWDGHDLRCFDWLTGREYHDELYRPMLDGSIYERDFFQWWKENYMGFLRFREGEERRGSARGWQAYSRDHQVLAQLRPLPELPAPPPRDDAALVEQPAPIPTSEASP